MKCFRSIGPIQSCSQEEFKIEVNPKIEFNENEEFEKIIQYIESPKKENKLIAIELAKGVFNMDCFDLCQNLRKKALSENNTYFLDDLTLFELLINGWYVSQVTNEPRIDYNNYMMDTKIELSRYNASILIETYGESMIFSFMSNKDKLLKEEPYKWFLLNINK